MIERDALAIFTGSSAKTDFDPFIPSYEDSTRFLLTPDDEPTQDDWDDAETIEVIGERQVDPSQVVPWARPPVIDDVELPPGKIGGGKDPDTWDPPPESDSPLETSPSLPNTLGTVKPGDTAPFSGRVCNYTGGEIDVLLYDCSRGSETQHLGRNQCTTAHFGRDFGPGNDWDNFEWNGRIYKISGGRSVNIVGDGLLAPDFRQWVESGFQLGFCEIPGWCEDCP